jgi:hypothetical protein
MTNKFFSPPVALAAISLMICPAVGFAQSDSDSELHEMSDDIGSDGIKRRGDGSIDDDQRDGTPSDDDDRIVIENTDVRTRGEGGARTRERSKITVNPVTGERRERTRNVVRLADGSKVETRTEIRTDAEGNVLRERTRTREKDARGRDRGRDDADRSDRADRSERADRAEREDRSERAERAERPERAERSERADRGERADRAERVDR